jgi:GTP pyrophosphokinase
MDHQTLMAALLHDVIEDSDTSKTTLGKVFGKAVAEIVDGVSKLSKIFATRAEAQAENFQKMAMAMAKDIRVIMVKMADRLHNMRTIGVMSDEQRKRIARETLDFYAPIANRLGIHTMKTELEELGFKALHPLRADRIERAVKTARGNRKELMEEIANTLTAALNRDGIEAMVIGREKHPYSIYRKMKTQHKSFTEITDVFGFRIVVEGVDTCYRTLGVVHNLFKPVAGRFKDYIAIPRINGYQSLHTTLFGPKGLPLEVQIRTREKDRVAESGVASHWQYKADEKSDATPQRRAREWLSKLAELQSSGTSEEFLESVKVDLFPDKIYVFTPTGDIMPLPKGATTVDFAYAVHTDIGNRCVAAKVDRKLVPLRSPLANSQTVEIVTAKGAKPNPNWLTFVRTAKARTAIRHYMKSMLTSESVDLGKRLLDQSLKDLGSSVRKVGKVRMKAALQELGIADNIELFQQIGLGERLAPLTARFLVGVSDEGNTQADTANLVIAGTEGVVVSYARCCLPIPGDHVMGYLSTGRGVVIHRNTCGNLTTFRKQPEKWITVSWEKDVERDFASLITVETRNKPGALAEVATTIADAGSNIEEVSVLGRHEDCSVMSFLLQVRDRKHVAQIMRMVRAMPNVLRVARECA